MDYYEAFEKNKVLPVDLNIRQVLLEKKKNCKEMWVIPEYPSMVK